VLESVLERARSIGFLGPGPVYAHVEHANVFRAAYEAVPLFESPPTRALDLGSGGGVPGLVLASLWTESEWVLLDASERRTSFLRFAVEELKLESRVSVVRGRAEELARRVDLRGAFDLVTARGFAPPAVTAECAAGFLRPNGVVIVSEPPEEQDRWDVEGLAELSLERVELPVDGAAVLRWTQALSDRYPRRVGIPGKRPLF
jgi:16S rRNA (guanine527-N7)-methyltransferase